MFHLRNLCHHYHDENPPPSAPFAASGSPPLLPPPPPIYIFSFVFIPVVAAFCAGICVVVDVGVVNDGVGSVDDMLFVLFCPESDVVPKDLDDNLSFISIISLASIAR